MALGISSFVNVSSGEATEECVVCVFRARPASLRLDFFWGEETVFRSLVICSILTSVDWLGGMFSSCRGRFSRFCSGVVVADFSMPFRTTIEGSLVVAACATDASVAVADFIPLLASSGIYLTSSKYQKLEKEVTIPTG